MKAILAFLTLSAVSLTGCRSGSGVTTNRFETADANHDRLLTQAEVGAYIASTLFDGLDKNRDKRLNTAEWNAGGSPMTSKTFHKADTNGDGFVSEPELQSAAIRSERMKEFIRGADTNHDGAVSKPEAIAYYASKE